MWGVMILASQSTLHILEVVKLWFDLISSLDGTNISIPWSLFWIYIQNAEDSYIDIENYPKGEIPFHFKN